jgi:arylsulfatase A-like enzyme
MIRPSLHTRVLLAMAFCVALAGCRKEPSPSATAAVDSAQKVEAAVSASAAPAAQRPVKPQQTFNVLLILIDSLRWDMPWTGYPREIAPRLTQFSKEWVLYPRAYSLSSYTAKSVVPALVGRYPSEMARDAYFFTRWHPQNVLVTEMAQAQGHRTLAGHGHGYFMPGLGVNQGYDDYRLLPGTFLDNTGVHDVNSDKLNRLAKSMLSDPKNVDLSEGKRFFAYYHFLDPHYSYHKHEEHPDFGNAPRDVYDNEVHFTDKWVGDLVDFVLSKPWGKDTAIVITADHGEGFGERGRFRHAYDVWESLVRVPLLIRIPGAEPRRIEEPRGHIDLAPTIAELMGIPPDAGFRGQSLLGEVFGESAQPRPVLVDLPRCDLMDRRRAFIDGKLKLIIFGDDKKFELFDVTEDVREERELGAENPELLARMKQKYFEFAAPIPNTPVLGGGPLKNAPPGQRW